LALLETVHLVSAGIPAVIEVDIVAHGHLLVDPRVGVVPCAFLGVALEEMRGITGPGLAVAGPRQACISHSVGIGGIGRIVGLEIVAKHLHHADKEVTSAQIAVHGVELGLARFERVVGKQYIVGSGTIDEVGAETVHGDAAVAGPGVAFAVGRYGRDIPLELRIKV